MKHSQKIKIYLSLFLLLFTALSCEDELEEQPFSQLSEEQFWKNNNDAILGVAAIYDAMQETYSKRHFFWGEFRADNYIAAESGSENNITLINNDLQVSSGEFASWENLYRMIGRANLAIEKIPQLPSFSPNLLGEAYALRAYAYFDAIRVWGDVPLFTEPITNATQDLTRPRTDATTILNDMVIPDMLKAEELITQQTNTFRFSLTSLWAFQANVYMWLGQYQQAKEKLDNIVALGAYELVTDRKSWSKLFLNDKQQGGKFQEGSELIFSIRYDLEAGDRSGIYSLFFAGIPSYYISPFLEDKWIEKFPITAEDWIARYPDFIPQTTDENGDILYGDWRYFESRKEDALIGEAVVAKWNKTNYSPSIDETDIVIYRYAGILLLLAEAENQLDNATRAIELVNQVRTARQLPMVAETDFTSKAALENFILDERQIELLGEGKRWWDLRRTNKAIEIMNPINGLTEDTLLFPIFQEHLNENPSLVQNPAYQ